ncbi:MAG: hypothetical protein IPM25_19945 [Chloracidobacterium sp.]|nr:hypothetical protein [Chloracidobacterium sp.]
MKSASKRYFSIIWKLLVAALLAILLYQIWSVYQLAENAAYNSCVESVENTIGANLSEARIDTGRLNQDWRELNDEEKVRVISTIQDPRILDCKRNDNLLSKIHGEPRLVTIKARRNRGYVEVELIFNEGN